MSNQEKLQHPDISVHELKIVELLKSHDGWLTNEEISVFAEVGERTTRQHTKRFADAGLLEVARVFPAFRYRYRASGEAMNGEYITRLGIAVQAVK